jgi:hypothetical protein
LVTFWVSNPFQTGTYTYSETNANLMDFDVWAGNYSLNLPEAQFIIQEANMVNEGANIYRSAIGSFSGIGYSISPSDTVNVSGEFCLNGWFEL